MNLEIKRGEYFVVLGPTGSGKSVLLETIAVMNVDVDNLFAGKLVIDTDTGIAYIDVKGTKIVSTSSKSGDVLISLRPEDIVVATERIETSARNLCRGEITEILDRGAIMRIVVDVCISFAVVITKMPFEDMALKEGMLAYITFKASAVHVF